MTKEAIYQWESSWAPSRRWEMTRKWKLWQHVDTDLLSARARYNGKHPVNGRKVIAFACWIQWRTWLVDKATSSGVRIIAAEEQEGRFFPFDNLRVTQIERNWVKTPGATMTRWSCTLTRHSWSLGFKNTSTQHSGAGAALHDEPSGPTSGNIKQKNEAIIKFCFTD